ncbi:hypothetical protein HanRHA438_Chr14g0681981 [Helianthus annuus]|nr:hypothetical protein HanRHA438_Chr14g0681981 [Helianthus annuus]
MFFPVIGQALVERGVFFLGDLFRFAKPDRFLFKVLMIKLKSWLISAWNANVSASAICTSAIAAN